MRLVTFEVEGVRRLGAVRNDRVIDVQRAGTTVDVERRRPGAEAFPASLLGLLLMGDEGLDALRATLGVSSDSLSYELGAVRLCAPLTAPSKILCIGHNYRDHVLEQNAPIPDKPIIFAKYANTVIGPGDSIIYPTTTEQLDYEAELVVVIGREGKHIPRDRAYDYVAGYTIGHDVTARDLQKSDKQWVRGKSQDSFAPLGPFLVTRDEIPDPQALDIRLWVNGELRQDSNTRNLIFDVPALIEFISQGITLSPGDLIFTGTPPGVGAYRNPPTFLRVGDEVAIEIEKLGRLTNNVVAESAVGQRQVSSMMA